MEVLWFRSRYSEVVHLYWGGRDQPDKQIAQYRGRTELLKGNITEGKVSLRIRNITPSDEGQFVCFFQSPTLDGEAVLELEVAG